MCSKIILRKDHSVGDKEETSKNTYLNKIYKLYSRKQHS